MHGSEATECAAPGVTPEVTWTLGDQDVPRSVISCNEAGFWYRVLTTGWPWVTGSSRATQDIPAPTPQFGCEPKTALKRLIKSWGTWGAPPSGVCRQLKP